MCKTHAYYSVLNFIIYLYCFYFQIWTYIMVWDLVSPYLLLSTCGNCA